MRYLFLILSLLVFGPLFAQDTPRDTITQHASSEALIDTSSIDALPPAPMADALRADGKIWVVVCTLLIVLAGFLLYLIRLDSRISKLEKSSRK